MDQVKIGSLLNTEEDDSHAGWLENKRHEHRVLGLWVAAGVAALLSYGIDISVANAQQPPRGFTPCVQGLVPPGTASFTLATTVSQNVHLNVCGGTVLLQNISAVEVFYAIGATNAVTASANDNSLPANSSIELSVPSQGASGYWVAAFTPGAGATVRLSTGWAW